MEMVDSMYFSQSWAVHVPLAVDSTIMGHTSVWNITGIVIVGAERAVVVVGTTFVLWALSRNSTGGLFYRPFAGFTAFSIFAALACAGRRPVLILGRQPRHRCSCVRFFPSSGLGLLLRYASIIESKT